MRILVTGSRDWDDVETIRDALWECGDPMDLILVHGGAPGADSIADAEARRTGWEYIEVHPADWDKHGKKAGFIRNAEMVALGATACLAFIKNNSKGATMTADLAEKAGIPTIRWHQT